MAKPITVSIVGNAGPLKKAVGEADTALGKLGGKIGNLGKIAAVGFAAAGAAAAVVGKQLIAAGEAASTSNARIKQIADSMGLFGDNASAVTDRLVKLAEATARNTGVDQNAIKLTQAKLLTFGELAKSAGELGGQFDRATIAAVDLAAAGFGEASTNAVQLGKALQDPIKGITALGKSGVTFTEIERERIQTLVDSNKVGEAQTLILEAIEKQVGGTAEATANASDRMKVAFSQVTERLGGVLLPIFERFTKFLIDDVFPVLQEMGDRFLPVISEAFGKVGDFIANRVVPVVRDVLIPIFLRLTEFITKNVVPVVMDLWKRVFSGLAGIFDVLVKKMQDNRENISKLVSFFRSLADFIVKTVAPILVKVLGGAFTIVTAALGPVLDVVFKLMGAFADLGSFLIKVAKSVLGTVETMVNGVIDIINKAIDGANKINPFDDIKSIPKLNLSGGASFTAPAAPTPGSGGSFNAPSLADRISNPSLQMPIVTIPSGGGGGSGGGGSGGGGGGGGIGGGGDLVTIQNAGVGALTTFGMAERIAAMESSRGSQSTPVNITVNTVTADANLPNLIVESLQRYNLISGPVDVQIAA
jgi:phage-related protein